MAMIYGIPMSEWPKLILANGERFSPPPRTHSDDALLLKDGDGYWIWISVTPSPRDGRWEHYPGMPLSDALEVLRGQHT